MPFSAIAAFNITLAVIFTCCFLYQIYYIVIALIRRRPSRKTFSAPEHSYAFVICAHNEGKVIHELIASIKNQSYPADKIGIFVFADNCSDNTAEVARQSGACVYERTDHVHVGKSWVMDYGFRKILNDYPHQYEGFFVFDADNVISQDYVRAMNEVFDQGYKVITSYRNSKNFASNWITSGYGTWFLREAQYLNNPRMLLGTGCAISGTGYLLSAELIEAQEGWDFHLLTEDIQFSAYCAIKKIQIAYCGEAEFFDEQPETFKASWFQRLRWSKGFYQVFYHYGKDLLKTAWFEKHFAGYDMLMTIAPAMILSIISVVVNSLCFIMGILFKGVISPDEVSMCGFSVMLSFASIYIVFFLLGLLTTITEGSSMHASTGRKILNLFTFPLFMLTYLPISLVALVKQVEWVPTEHTISKSLDEILKK